MLLSDQTYMPSSIQVNKQSEQVTLFYDLNKEMHYFINPTGEVAHTPHNIKFAWHLLVIPMDVLNNNIILKTNMM